MDGHNTTAAGIYGTCVRYDAMAGRKDVRCGCGNDFTRPACTVHAGAVAWCVLVPCLRLCVGGCATSFSPWKQVVAQLLLVLTRVCAGLVFLASCAFFRVVIHGMHRMVSALICEQSGSQVQLVRSITDFCG
jgi:hypothetical protein